MDISSITKFNKIRISPPLHKSDLAKVITELEGLLQALHTKGEKERKAIKNRFIKRYCYFHTVDEDYVEEKQRSKKRTVEGEDE